MRPFRYDLNKIPNDYTVEVRNRFKGLDLIDRVPDKLWTEVCDIVQETGIKTIPKKQKCKKATWLSEEALQIDRCEKKGSEKQRRKGTIYPFECRVPKNSKEKYESLPQPSMQKTEENNRIGKTRDLFKKIRDTKQTFHAKMGSIKDINLMDLTEAKILRRGGKNTQKNCTKKIFMTQIIIMV